MRTVATTGTLQPAQQVSLSFPAAGQLSALNVAVGQTVTVGQVLARLNDTTIAPQVAQAQAQVAEAQANLEKAQEGPSPQAVAVARAAVQHAQVVLAGAETQYQDEEAIYNDRLSAQQSVDQARNQVNQAAAALQVAQANVQAAENKLAQAQAGVNTSALNTLNDTIEADETALNEAQNQLSLDQNTLNAAQQDLNNAQALYNAEVGLWGLITPAQYVQAENDLISSGCSPNSTSTGCAGYQATVSEYNLESGAQQQVNQAQSAVSAAQKAVNADNTQVQQAEAALAQAQNQQANLQALNPLSVQAAQIGVQQAQAAQAQAEAAYQAAQNSLSLAQALYNDRTAAKAQLDQAKNAVAQAQNGVTTAQAQLAETEAPPDPATVAQAAAQVQAAQASLMAAQAAEANTILKAPISGVVVAVNGTVGAQTTPATPVVVIDDTVKTDLQVNVTVPEADIGQVHPGETLQLTVPAYPSTTFSGTVTQVYPVPQLVNNVPEYTVLGVVHDPAGRLTPAMTANVTLITARARGVPVVPPVALHTLGSRTGVYVEGAPGRARRRAGSRPRHLPPGVYFQPVQVTLFGTSSVEVSGLRPGTRILLILPGQTAALPNSGPLPGGPGGLFRGAQRALKGG
ncbi:MAG: HlyD family efflux transporter periplasmic adaptor subunit [Firmicutes bacterium]|nr:HlyD family efflux transporter periplasmic adaptor subunit [Bacillota bacterium]